MAKDRKSKASKKGKGDSNKQLHKTVASLLAADKEKETNTTSEVQEIHKYLASFMSGTSTSAVLPTKPSTYPPTLTPPVSADVAANQAALQLQGILCWRRNNKLLTLVTLSLKGKLSDPDNTNALVPHLVDYPVANGYVNARVCDMNATEDEDENSDSRS